MTVAVLKHLHWKQCFCILGCFAWLVFAVPRKGSLQRKVIICSWWHEMCGGGIEVTLTAGWSAALSRLSRSTPMHPEHGPHLFFAGLSPAHTHTHTETDTDTDTQTQTQTQRNTHTHTHTHTHTLHTLLQLHHFHSVYLLPVLWHRTSSLLCSFVSCNWLCPGSCANWLCPGSCVNWNVSGSCANWLCPGSCANWLTLVVVLIGCGLVVVLIGCALVVVLIGCGLVVVLIG